MLLKELPEVFTKVISHTTRPPRTDEVKDKDYYFITEEEFQKMIKEDKFMEHCSVYGQSYGTTKDEFAKALGEKKICVMEVDVQGAQKINKANIDCNYLFLYPPSPEELKDRIAKRGIEDEDMIKMRLESGLKEIEFANKTILYKHRIINDKLETSYEEFRDLLMRIYKQEVKMLKGSK